MLPFKKEVLVINPDAQREIPAKIMMNIAIPDTAFALSVIPNDGVGLARIEFIIGNVIHVHPMACVSPEKVKDERVLRQIYEQAIPYTSLSEFFVDSLARGIAMIAAAFYPKPVIVRTSDFKSNEYRNLIAGSYFEPEEENPMLGWRGASRYYSHLYKDAFALECAAFKKVRNEMGLKNVKIMLPFVRTPLEAQKVINLMKQHGLEKGVDGLELVMMCEIPSNVLLMDEFSALFDGFSIGSNDLTQLTLGVDRDSGLLKELFDERDKAVQKMLELAINGAHRNKKFIGICGQAPSDYPEIAHFLISLHIDSLSLNPDSIMPFINDYAKFVL
jgi:pyruvate,water dikinase